MWFAKQIGTYGMWIFILAIAATTPSSGNPPPMTHLRHQTFTYKTVGYLEIQAEVTRADDEGERPVLVWIHGGALIMGGRRGIGGAGTGSAVTELSSTRSGRALFAATANGTSESIENANSIPFECARSASDFMASPSDSRTSKGA